MPPSVSFKTLLIAESPSKCKTIERLLGPGYSCVATCGHLRDLAIKTDLSDVPAILSSRNPPPYTKSSKKMDYIRNIQSAISKCNGTIILATDADREGESIAWHICQLFNLPVETTPRIVFNEITQPALQTALRNPRRVDMNLVNSQQARQVIDFVIGYGITPLLWNKTQTTNPPASLTKQKTKSKPVQSAGRCQTPALRIMYDAYVKMKAAALNPLIEYRCTGHFGKYDIPFSLSKRISCDDIAGFLSFYTQSETSAAVALKHIFERCGDIEEVTYKPPPALKTTTLQQFGSRQLKISPSETMEVAQRLYELGYITYHRTESTNVSDEFRDAASLFVRSNWGDAYIAGKASTKKTTTTGYAHEAIRPVNIHTVTLPATSNASDSGEFGKNEKRMYAFIWLRAVCSCMANASYEKLTAKVSVMNTYTYTYSAYRPTFTGWRACVSRMGSKVDHPCQGQDIDDCQDQDPQDPQDQQDQSDFTSPQFSSLYFDYLQSIFSGSSLPYNSIDCLPVVANACRPYTYGGLIRQLEKMGIGRPSTFASILNTLKKRDYITTSTAGLDDENPLTSHVLESKETYKIVNRGNGPIGGTATVISTRTGVGTSAGAAGGVGGTKQKTSTGYIQITPNGRQVIEALFPKCEPVLAYKYTREMEERLDEVAGGRMDWSTVCQTCTECVTQIKKSTFSEPATAPTIQSSPSKTPLSLSPGIMRHVTEHISVRQGQYGAYLFYRTPAMKKPKFISLKDFPYSFMECDACLISDWVDKHV
jgi:DNA topoisomerase-1